MKLEELYEESCIITEDEVWEMLNINPKDTGINCIIYASTKNTVHGRHGPRVKISNIPNNFSPVDNFAVSISEEPKIVAGKCKFNQSILTDIYEWIKLNYNPLIKYWNIEYESNRYFYMEIKSLNDS